MNEVRFSTRFKKDIKRYEHDELKLMHLYKIVTQLENDEKIPQENRRNHHREGQPVKGWPPRRCGVGGICIPPLTRLFLHYYPNIGENYLAVWDFSYIFAPK